MGGRGERRMRRSRLLAVVMLAGLALSGCSLVGDGQQVWGILQEEAAQQEALTAALEELQALGGVKSVSSRFRADGPRGDEADINVVAERSAATPELVAMARAAGEALAGEQLGSAVRLFTLEIDGGGLLTQSFFAIADDQLAAQLTYWRAAEVALAARLSLNLVESGGEPPYRREFRPSAGSDALRATEQFIANYPALQALPDDSAATSWWFFPGISAQPDLPPAELVGLLDEIRAVVPLLDFSGVPEDAPLDYEYPEGAAVSWSQLWPEGPMHADVSVHQREHRASDWPMVLEVAALTSAVPQLNFSYNATVNPMDSRQFRFHTSVCEGEAFVTADDRTLVAAMKLAGVVLPGGGPGFCQPPPPGS